MEEQTKKQDVQSEEKRLTDCERQAEYEREARIQLRRMQCVGCGETELF